MDKALLDTDILSESRKRINQQVVARATAYTAAFSHFTISVVTVTEVIKGWRKRQQEAAITKFLADLVPMEVLPVNTSIAELAGRIYGDLERTGQPIGLADSIIAATAIDRDLILITGNISHYQRIQAVGYSLKLDNWRSYKHKGVISNPFASELLISSLPLRPLRLCGLFIQAQTETI